MDDSAKNDRFAATNAYGGQSYKRRSYVSGIECLFVPT
jgi:hypothetical protein